MFCSKGVGWQDNLPRMAIYRTAPLSVAPRPQQVMVMV